MFKNLFPIAALLGMLLLPLGAAAEEVCEHPDSEDCGLDEYRMRVNPDCEDHFTCPSHTEPPGVSQFTCLRKKDMFHCTTYPQGSSLSYSYYSSISLSLSWDGPTDSPTVWVTCQQAGVPGNVTVTVTSPFGISSSKSTKIPCE